MNPQPPPPFDIVGPRSQRLTVSLQCRADTVGDLAVALGFRRVAGLSIDGRPATHHEPLVASGVRVGSVVGPPDAPPGRPDASSGQHDVPPGQPDVSSGQPGPPEVGPRVEVEAVVVTGPSCGLARPLRPGRHIVGRSSSADVRVEDPSVELHHGVLDVADGGEVTFRQLTGRRPTTIGNVPCDGVMPVPHGAVLTVGSSEVVVRRRADVSGERAAGRLVPLAGDPWRRIVQRGPADPARAEPITIRLPASPAPEPMPPATGLIGAGVAVGGAAAVAIVLGQMMFALFAAIGALASCATWAVGVVGVLRRRRAGRRLERDEQLRFATELDTARRVERAAHARDNPTIERALRTLDAIDAAPATDVWHRHGADALPLRAVLGRGAQRWTPPIDADSSDAMPPVELDGVLTDVAVGVELTAGTAFAVRGDEVARSVVRSIVVQLAAHHGPTDWQLIVVTRSPDIWRWVGWLPHARTAAGNGVALIDAAELTTLGAKLDVDMVRPDRTVVLVADDTELFATRTGPLRRFIDVASPCTIALAPAGAPVPALCSDVLDVSATGALKWSGGRDGGCGPFRPTGISGDIAAVAARALAGLVDPEDEFDAAAALPCVVTLADVDDAIAHVQRGASDRAGGRAGDAAGGRGGEAPDDPVGNRAGAAALAQRWVTAGDDPAPVAALGMSAEGLVEVDLVRDGPHALIAGTTGAGKSELLRTLVVGLALRQSPDQLCFVLVDYKGGSTFDACNDLVHTVGTVTDLDAGLAERALVSLEAELHRRERLLRAVGASDLTEYRSERGRPSLPRLVVVIDEFAALAKDLPDFLVALVGIAQRGRSLGLHLILATQRPAGVVNDDIRANTNLRIALRLNATADAADVVGDDGPAAFPRGVPGRAALRLGPDELVTFQTASCSAGVEPAPGRLRVTPAECAGDAPTTPTDDVDRDAVPAMSQLSSAVAVIADAARLAGTAPPHRPWIDALPDELAMTAVDRSAAADAIGVIDDPAAQGRRPLRWDVERGNLALVGALGTGRSSTLVGLLASRCRVQSPDRLHCYVIDAHGEAAFDAFARLAHCGGAIRVSDLERVHRLLVRLVGLIDERATGAAADVEVLLAIDGLRSLRTALAMADRAPTSELLDRVLADGPAVRVVSCWSDAAPNSGAAPHVADTWSFGSPGAEPRTVVPGRVRVTSSGLLAQVARDAGSLDGLPIGPLAGGPATVERLPERIRATAVIAPTDIELDDSALTARPAAAPLELPLGVADESLEVATLRVPPCDHVFIGGAALTGKTTTLTQLSHAWRRLHPTGVQLFVHRRDPLTEARLEAAADRPVLVVVDDAERIDDVSATLAGVVAGSHPGVTIAAAARVDAVRASYGHWTRDVARSRCGMILTSAGEVDGDLLGVVLPRHSLIAPRPGLGWLIDNRGHRLVQVAQADVEFVGQSGDGGVSPSNQRGPAPCRTAASPGL